MERHFERDPNELKERVLWMGSLAERAVHQAIHAVLEGHASLAQKVLQGATRDYKHHPQLIRFRAHPKPSAALATYLKTVHDEATRRSYQFDGSKILRQRTKETIRETNGQLLYEWEHLKRKLRRRNPKFFAACRKIKTPEPHPLFKIVSGKVRDWEKVR